jgi:signal transduction histidine kinase
MMSASAARVNAQEWGTPLDLRRILLVEDNPGDADLARERLAEADSPAFDVCHAMTLAAAIESLAARPSDAIILDLGLPDSRGIETVSRLKVASRDIPIIVVSGYVDDNLRALAIAEGAEDVFTKDESNSRLFWRSVLQIIEHRRVQHRQLQTLLDATPDAILVVDRLAAIRYVNRAALALFERSREELLGDRLDLAMRSGELTEIAVPRADGKCVCEMHVVPLQAWHDDSTSLVVIRDITERKQAEALRVHSVELAAQNRQIMEASRLKSRFLSNISHELRTPLNAIIGFSNVLHDGLVDSSSPKYKEFLGYIVSGGNHLLQLINNLLDLAAIEAGKIKFSPESVDLPALMHDVVAVLGALSMEKHIAVEVNADPALPRVYLDPGRLKQVMYNYLSNALKFTPEGGSVAIRSRVMSDAMFRLEVADTGMGIEQDHIAQLFSEFYQIESGTAKTHQGTGLGLALTRHLVEAQGGSVGVSSVRGEGSVFFVELPRMAAGGEAAL